MPLFEYLCPDCGAEFEKIVSTYKTRVVCDSCRSPRVEKKLSVFAVAGGEGLTFDDAAADGGCGTCGADQPGMCQM